MASASVRLAHGTEKSLPRPSPFCLCSPCQLWGWERSTTSCVNVLEGTGWGQGLQGSEPRPQAPPDEAGGGLSALSKQLSGAGTAVVSTKVPDATRRSKVPSKLPVTTGSGKAESHTRPLHGGLAIVGLRSTSAGGCSPPGSRLKGRERDSIHDCPRHSASGRAGPAEGQLPAPPPGSAATC